MGRAPPVDFIRCEILFFLVVMLRSHGLGHCFDFGGDALYHFVEVVFGGEKAVAAQDFLDAFTEVFTFFRSEEQCCCGTYDCSAKECKQMFHIALSLEFLVKGVWKIRPV